MGHQPEHDQERQERAADQRDALDVAGDVRVLLLGADRDRAGPDRGLGRARGLTMTSDLPAGGLLGGAFGGDEPGFDLGGSGLLFGVSVAGRGGVTGLASGGTPSDDRLEPERCSGARWPGRVLLRARLAIGSKSLQG